jgi:PAB-dependent poly(A)-specific ribonuclease subunit 3
MEPDGLRGNIGANPFVPSTSIQALNAPSFVPSSAASLSSFQAVTAQEFVHSSSTAGFNLQQPIPRVEPTSQSNLPEFEGDSSLGMSVGGAAIDSARLASHAAQMFQQINLTSTTSNQQQQQQSRGQTMYNNISGSIGLPYITASASPSPAGMSAAMMLTTGRGGGGGRSGSGGGSCINTGIMRGRGRGGRSYNNSGSGSTYAYMNQQLVPGKAPKAALFIPSDLHLEIKQRAHLEVAQLDPETAAQSSIPESIHSYHSIISVEDLATDGVRASCCLQQNLRSVVMKGVSAVDGKAYALRRIDPRSSAVPPSSQLLAAAQDGVVAKWSQIPSHPGLAPPREAFISNEGFGGTQAFYFAHDYFPGAITLEEAHLQPTVTAQGDTSSHAMFSLDEETLWSYVCQLTCALRVVHSAGLFVGEASLHPSKILLTGPFAPPYGGGKYKNKHSSSYPGQKQQHLEVSSARICISSLGVQEVISGEALTGGAQTRDVSVSQRNDLAALGNLIIELACESIGGGVSSGGHQQQPASLDYLAAHYSRELAHVVAGLLACRDNMGFAGWKQLANALGERLLDELDTRSARCDALMSDLGAEVDNGRLLRLMMKLCAVTERPQLGGDHQWAETGDRYLVKLFRDFCFHQDDENGKPLLDWGVPLEALNKVDAGVGERVMMLNREETAMLVVSYADIRKCLESSYMELEKHKSAPY